jgi:hypothetical protein
MRNGTRSLVASLGATAVAVPLGRLAQSRMTFTILDFEDMAPGPAALLLAVVTCAALGLATWFIAGAPVAWAVNRVAPRAPWLAVAVSAGLAVALFRPLAPWGLRPHELAWLLGLTLTFFGVRRLLTQALRGHRAPAPTAPAGTPRG